MTPPRDRPARIYVIAGVNGSGKSSIGGARLRDGGGDYYNPDEVARRLREARPALGPTEANGLAWQKGRMYLERAIRERRDFAFETTLGANTIPALLAEAAQSGIEVRVWYVGLANPEMHLARIASRVARGGHSIPEADVRRRFTHSRLNLIGLLPHLAELRLYDNSVEADPAEGCAPAPGLLVHYRRGQVLEGGPPADCPAWARPIVVAVAKFAGRKRR